MADWYEFYIDVVDDEELSYSVFCFFKDHIKGRYESNKVTGWKADRRLWDFQHEYVLVKFENITDAILFKMTFQDHMVEDVSHCINGMVSFTLRYDWNP
jgi:hypothetical protein